MSLLRRALGAVALGVGFAAALRVGGFVSSEPRQGGWRDLHGPAYR